MKKTCVLLLAVCLICSMLAPAAFGASADFTDTFDKDLVISTTDGWTLKAADGTAGTIVAEDYIVDSSKKALTYTSAGVAGKTLTSERVFPGRAGNFVIDFEVAFKTKGAVNLLYAYQGSSLLFTVGADVNKFVGYVGTGAYDNSATSVTYLPSYTVNTPYHFQIAINSDKQIFNMYINGEAVMTNVPLRNKITTGMTKAALLQAGNSAAVWQLEHFSIRSPEGAPSASDVTIDKTPYLGRTVTANYTFNDTDALDNSSVKWMYSNAKDGTYKYVSDTESKSLTITPDLAGSWIKAEVTPVNGMFATGAPVYSEPVQDMTAKNMAVDENSSYVIKNNAVWDAENDTLTVTTKESLGGEGHINVSENLLGTVVMEAKIKNKNKDNSNAFYVYQDGNYVFNVTFDASNINLLCSSVAGSNNYLHNKLVLGYAADTWYDFKAIIDTATSTADFYINGELIFDDAGLRSNLSTKGITKIFSSRGNSPDGETYIKSIRLYSISAPEHKASAVKVHDAVIYTDYGKGCARLSAELVDQFGEKVEGGDFTWSLTNAIDGVSITEDGVLTIDKKAFNDDIEVKAESKTDSAIYGTKTIRVNKRLEIADFAITANDGKEITTLDRSITATATANVKVNTGSKDVTMLIAFYNANGDLMYANIGNGAPEYGTEATVSAALSIEYNDKTKGGYFKAFMIDNLNNIKPLTESISSVNQ